MNPNIPPEVRLNLRRQFGLDDPLVVRYVRWMSSMLQGDWGYSFVSRVPVTSLIWQRLPTTLFVLGSAYGMALLMALPVGILSALKPYSLFDQIATTLVFIGYALPTFFTGLLFILLFSIYLHWLPFIYSSTIEVTGLAWIIAHLRQAVMPIGVLGIFEAASLTRFVRASMLEVIHQDFVTTARAKGLSEWRTVLVHVLRNALLPVVTVMALQIPTIFTGAVITEQIFRVPGIGSLLIASIESTDTPVVMAIAFVYATLVVIFSLIADMVYGLLDPRITYS
jgi:peptide/nickel transport system permease protein